MIKCRRLKSPLMVQLEITPLCDNKCGFCYNFWKNEPSKAIEVKSESIIGFYDKLIENEVSAICLTGGEPLLEEQLVYRLLKKSKNNGLYTSINTNGRLITKENAERLRRLGLKSALVSIHGSTSQNHDLLVGVKGAFEETIKGISLLLSHGINVTANYVVSKINIKDLEKTSYLLRKLGVRNLTVTPLLPFKGVKEHLEWALEKEQFKQYFKALINVRRQGLKVDSTLPILPCVLVELFPECYVDYLEVASPRVCMAGVTFMVVSPKGVNRACIQAPELADYGSDILVDFKDAWGRAHMWSDESLIPPNCMECEALSICGGGCRTSSLALNNSVNGPTMYMGKPLTKEVAEPFLKRIEIKENEGNLPKLFKKKVFFSRKEDFGATLANTSNQSYVLLNMLGIEAYSNLPFQFRYTWGDKYTDRFIRVIWAAGFIDPSKRGEKYVDFTYRLQNEGIVHIHEVFPRLGKNLPKDDHVRCLRGDTGERIFF